MKTKNSIIFTLFFTSLSVSALYSDSLLMSEDAKAQLKFYQTGTVILNDTGNAEKSSSIANEAYQYCGAKLNGPVSKNLKNLMKVGLHNYCDQYSDPADFCICIGEITYEKKLSKKDLNEFKNSLEKENIQNIAFTSIKSLVDFNSEKILADISSNREVGRVALSCTSPKKFNESISDECSENELNIIREGYTDYNKNCDETKCLPGHKLENLPNDARNKVLSSNQKMFALSGHIASEESSRLVKNNYFNTQQIMKADSNFVFGTIHSVQQHHLATAIAERLKEKWNRSSVRINSIDSYNKYHDTGLIESLKDLMIFDNVPGYDNPEAAFYSSKTSARKAIDSYLSFFESKIKGYAIQDLNLLSKNQIRNLVTKAFNKQTDLNIASSCEKAKNTFRKSCKMIKEKQIAFDFTDKSSDFRDKNYKEDKFKFDQLYCVSQGISTDKIVEESKWYISMFEKSEIYKIKQASPPIDYLITKSGDIDDFHWMNGLSNSTISGMMKGTKIEDYSYKTDNIFGYDDGYGGMFSARGFGGAISNDPTYDFFGNSKVISSEASSEDFESSLSGGYNTWKTGTMGEPFVNFPDLVSPKNFNETIVELKPEPTLLPELLINAAVVDSQTKTVSSAANEASESKTEAKVETNSLPDNIVSESLSGFSDANESTSNQLDFNQEVTEAETQPFENEASFFSKEDKKSFSENFRFNKDKKKEDKSNIEFSNMTYKELEIKNQMEKISEITNKIKSKEEVEVVTDIEEVTDALAAAKNDLEIQKLKLELEKTKLELANTEKLIKKEKSAKVIAPIVTKKQTVIERPVATSRKSSNTRSANTISAQARNVSTTPSSFASTRSAPQQAPQARSLSSASSSSASRSAPKQASSLDYVPTASSSKRGALLSAVSVTNEQISNDSNSKNSGVQIIKSTDELVSIDQKTLAKYYEEGKEFIVQDEELELADEGQTLQLEKDEKSGIIKVVKKKTNITRLPASIPQAEEPVRERKVFSYDEFKTILDSSRED